MFLMEAYGIFRLFCTLLAPTPVLVSPELVIVMHYRTGCSFLIGDGWVLSIASPCREKMHTNGNYGFNSGQGSKQDQGKDQNSYIPQHLSLDDEADHNCLSKWKLIFESKKLARHSKTGVPKGLNLKMPEFFAFAELSDPQSPLFPQNFVSSDQDIYQTGVLSTVVGIALRKSS